MSVTSSGGVAPGYAKVALQATVNALGQAAFFPVPDWRKTTQKRAFLHRLAKRLGVELLDIGGSTISGV